MNTPFALAIVSSLLIGSAIPALAQAPEDAARQTVIEEAQAQKSETLQPYVPTKSERLVSKFAELDRFAVRTAADRVRADLLGKADRPKVRDGAPDASELGILLREDGKFEAAEAAYRRALETDPDHALAHYNLGVLLDIYLRRTAEALEHYEAYQASLAQPDETVGRWIIDLRRRAGNGTGARVAQGEGL